MAFYTEERLNENRVLTDADFNVGFTDYLGATIRDAWNDNPTVAVADLWDVQRAQIGDEAVAGLLDQRDDLSIDVSDFEYTASPALSMEDQQSRIKEAGLEKHIKAQEGYNAEALDLIMGRKREELERQIIRQSASDWYAPAGFIAGLGTSMLDPINLASNFIPGVGQIRALRMLQEGAKEGAKGLALRRAVIGAAEGSAGSVVVEPLVAFARSQQQADYGMTDSLLNVAFGTVMGATLHPAIGAWGDYKRRQVQKNNPLVTAPWEVMPPTDKTEALRHQFAQDALAKAREAGASMTEEQAYASAALFDARARTVAYFENIDPEEYYRRHRPEFEAELERMGELEQGMYRNKADMRTFIQNTMAGMYGKKTFIGIGELSNEAFPGYELQMTDDTVRHVLREEHAGFDDWESVVDVVNTGEAEALDVSTRVTGNKVTVYAKQYGDRVQVALVSPRSEKRRELMLLTTFNTTEKGYAQWMEGIKKDPSQTDAYILTGRGGESPQGLPTGYEGSFSEINIPQTGGDINTLLQRAWHGTPHDFDAFTLQAIGTGEGAQAHGWGLYFAKNKTTAKRYKTGLSKGKGGRLFEVDIPENKVLLDEQKKVEDQHKNVQKLILEAIQAMSESEQDVFYKRILGSKLDDSEAYNKATAKLDRERLFLKAITGIADSKFVRIWHRKNLLGRGYSEEQIDELWADTEKAKAEIQKFLPEVQKLEAEQKVLKQKDDERRARILADAKSNPEVAIAKVFGEELYDAIAWAVSKENHPDFRAASEALNAAGIKGITYEGGRDGRCFVVFDDKAIQILDKLYQIIGEKGAARLDRAREETVRTDNLAVAVKMAAEGRDDITIRLATGWEQGVDGKWRYEIPDGRLDFSGLKGKVQRDRYTPKGAHRAARLKDVLIMPDLYAAYPEIANIRVFTQTLPRQEHAAVQMYSDGTKVIVLNSRYAKPGKPTEAILSNIVHEVQHVIQSAEGFIQGSNPKKAGGFERYEQVAGEAEARNAEGRIGFSEEERRNFLLSSTSDVPAGDMRTPDGKPLRDPRLPVEPVGPLMGREPRHALPEELPDDYDLGLPPEMPDVETPRGSVTFRPEDGKAVITFFKNTDASTLPHEMFHIFRRELAETAGMEGASPQSKDMWAKVCEFVGAKEGEPWTREQEEMFARAGERYLLEGKAPNSQLRGVFERMRQWFMEIYTSVDAAGMEISDTMRQVFGDMFRLSPEEADMAFRYGFGRMLEWDGSEGTDTAIPELPESDDPAIQEELTGLAAQRLEESLQGVADRPEFAEAVRAQVEQEIAELDAEMAQAKIQGDVLLEAALCDMRN